MAKSKRALEVNDTLFDNIIEKPLEKVLPDSMLPYSETIIMERALPRVEDGLKPVQRRILFAMNDLGMKPEGQYKKSARVVGECLGKYHPHGDSSVYDAMVRMAQGFNMRMELVDGHGNFGSVDGDSAAAMRYTEVKLKPLAMELLRDLDKGTVTWSKNFDDTLDEPDLLPGKFPNLLVNGSTGIAIGIATNIPTHNITEVIEGCIAMIERPNISLDELMQYIKGPDFPTGGFLLQEGIRDVYATGRGKLILRAKVDIENVEGDKQNIVITEIPYAVNKRTLLEKIYQLKETQKEILGNVIDVCDESDRNGMRVVVKLKKGEDAVKILEYLMKYTDLQTTYNPNMVAIAGGKPRQMGLIEILKYYLEFQRTVILKRSQYEMNIAKKREHILNGYMLIMPAIDEVIQIIRTASTRAEAKVKLKERFELSDAQAEAILCLQLGNINKLDVNKFDNELDGLRKNIANLTKIIGSKAEQFAVVKSELTDIKDRFKTKRRTTIIGKIEDLDVKSFDPTKRTAKKSIVAVDAEGGVKMMSTRNYLGANREAEDCDYNSLAVSMVEAEPQNVTLVFSNNGNCYKVEEIKEKRWEEAGIPLNKAFASALPDEKAVFAVSVNPDEIEDKQFYLYTKQGMVKKTEFRNYIVSKDSYQVINLKDGDEVLGGEFEEPNATIMFVTSDGLCVNTETSEYPTQGRIAGGVIGVSLNDNEQVVYAGQTTVESVSEDGTYLPLGEVVVITDKGLGKKVIASEFESMKRNRKGIKIIDVSDKSKVAFASKVLEPYQIAVVDADNELTVVDTESVRIDKRETKGKPIVRNKKIKKIIKHIDEV